MEKIQIMSVNQLALTTKYVEEQTPEGVKKGLRWTFPTAEMARLHLRKYEPFLASWGFRWQKQIGEPFRLTVVASDSNQSWPITPREAKIRNDILPSPLTVESPQEDDPDYLLVSTLRLPSKLIDILVEMRQNKGIKAVVDWSTQKQVILTRDCNQIPIGTELEQALEFSRYDYWVDPEPFLVRCQQELRQDGSNTIDHTYLTFDPTTGDDWIEIDGRYRMIDCGSFGMYQLGENLAFRSVASPFVVS